MLNVVRALTVVNFAIVVGMVACAHAIGLDAPRVIPLVLTALLSAVPVALRATFTLASALGAKTNALNRRRLVPRRARLAGACDRRPYLAARADRRVCREATGRIGEAPRHIGPSWPPFRPERLGFALGFLGDPFQLGVFPSQYIRHTGPPHSISVRIGPSIRQDSVAAGRSSRQHAVK